MPIVLNFLILAAGIVILLWAGDILVRGAASLARKWGIPSLIVGLTIVAFGTSAPEMVVSVQAVLNGASELAIGNVVGSNIANVLLVLGLPALIMAIKTDTPGVARNAVIMLGATLGFIALLFIQHPLMRWQGAVLFAGIIGYLLFMLSLAKSGAKDPALEEMEDIDDMGGMPQTTLRMTLYIVLGLIGLVIGGKLIVDNAVLIASYWGVSDEIIGLTIVAVGTSLPELATCIVAAYRGHAEVAIGNVLGSNIFNIFAVMGAAALAGPVIVPGSILTFDIWVMLAAGGALATMIFIKKPIGRLIGGVFFLGYVLYVLAIARSALAASAVL